VDFVVDRAITEGKMSAAGRMLKALAEALLLGPPFFLAGSIQRLLAERFRRGVAAL